MAASFNLLNFYPLACICNSNAYFFLKDYRLNFGKDKTMKKSLLLFSALVGLSLASSAQAITVTGTVQAVIKGAITATETQQMNFGTISSAATAGVVTMTAAGVRSSSSLSFYNNSQAGIFNVTADPSTALTISFANGTLSSGSNNMTLSNFTHSTSTGTDTTDSSGKLTLNVGADLNVGASQPSGSYSGTYNVTLSY